MVNEHEILKPLTLLNPPANTRRLLNYLPEESNIPFPGNHTTNLRGRCFTKWHLFLTSLLVFLKKLFLFCQPISILRVCGGFPSGSVVKNHLPNAGDAGSIPGLGRSTCCGVTKPMSNNYWACDLEPRNHNCWGLHALDPVFHRWSHGNEKPKYRNYRLVPAPCN